MDPYIELLKAVLPEFLIDHFNFTRHTIEEEKMHLYFEEKKDLPKEWSDRMIIGHGFHNEVTVQDFPLRGHAVYLHIKKRRWFDKNTKQAIQRDWNLVAEGTRLTEGFAAFLKEISRY